MKKALIIALSCLVVMLVACKKPVEPTPEPVDYAPNYVGNYIGQFTLTINSMNNSAVSNMTFPIDNIGMDIAKGEMINTITAAVAVENEIHYTDGTVTQEKADFGTVHLVIDKPDQFYKFELDLEMEGNKTVGDTLNITGSFAGSGSATIMGQEQVFNEVSGTLVGKLAQESRFR